MPNEKRLAPTRSKNNPHLEIIRLLIRQIDFEMQYQKQELTRTIRSLDYPLKLYFLREGTYLHFSFEGFGDLMGYQLSLSHEGSMITSAFVNHNGDATLCIDSAWLPSDFRLTISPTSVG